MKKIFNIAGWVILLLAFGSLGFSSDAPVVGFIIYLAFFTIVFGLVYVYIKKHHRKTEVNPKTITLIHKIAGIVLLVIGLFSPIIALGKIKLPFFPNFLILIATAIIIGLGVFAVTMVNSVQKKKMLGYILLIVLSAIPALFAISYLDQFFPNAYNALGTAYWAIVSVAIFSWWGFNLYLKKE